MGAGDTKRRLQADDKPEPLFLKTRPQKSDYKQTTKLNRGGRKHGPKKAMGVTCHPRCYVFETFTTKRDFCY
jgi:hypothetical protein